MQDGAITLAAVRRLDQSSGVKMVEVRAGRRPPRAEAAGPGWEGGAGQGRRSGQDLVSGWLRGPPAWSPVPALSFPHGEAKAVLPKRGPGRVVPLLSSLNISCPLRIKIQVLTMTRLPPLFPLPLSHACSSRHVASVLSRPCATLPLPQQLCTAAPSARTPPLLDPSPLASCSDVVSGGPSRRPAPQSPLPFPWFYLRCLCGPAPRVVTF